MTTENTKTYWPQVPPQWLKAVELTGDLGEWIMDARREAMFPLSTDGPDGVKHGFGGVRIFHDCGDFMCFIAEHQEYESLGPEFGTIHPIVVVAFRGLGTEIPYEQFELMWENRNGWEGRSIVDKQWVLNQGVPNPGFLVEREGIWDKAIPIVELTGKVPTWQTALFAHREEFGLEPPPSY